MIKRFLVSLLLLIGAIANAQTAAGPEMADGFRENGKIYIVITVIGMIFAAIVIFLVILERKLKRLEDKVNEGK